MGIVDWHEGYSNPTPFYVDFPSATSGPVHFGPLTEVHVDWIDRGSLPGQRYQTTISSAGRTANYGTTYSGKGDGWADVYICDAGSTPGPDVPPPPVPDRPPGAPDAPPPATGCTADDICNQLAIIVGDIQRLFAAIAELKIDVDDRLDLIQRDTTDLLPLVKLELTARLGCPRADVSGKLLEFLPAALVALRPTCVRNYTSVAAGSIIGTGVLSAPAGAIGLLLEVTDVPAYYTQIPSAPPASNYGWVAFGAASGYRTRQPVQRGAHVYMPLPDYTTGMAYRLIPPISAGVTWLVEGV